jgi:hypothetical protein
MRLTSGLKTCLKMLSKQGEWYMIILVTSVEIANIDVTNKQLLLSVGTARQKNFAYLDDEKTEKEEQCDEKRKRSSVCI